MIGYIGQTAHIKMRPGSYLRNQEYSYHFHFQVPTYADEDINDIQTSCDENWITVGSKDSSKNVVRIYSNTARKDYNGCSCGVSSRMYLNTWTGASIQTSKQENHSQNYQASE